jgi:hypothetical protein
MIAWHHFGPGGSRGLVTLNIVSKLQLHSHAAARSNPSLMKNCNPTSRTCWKFLVIHLGIIFWSKRQGNLFACPCATNWPSFWWPAHEGTVTNPEPLLECDDSWKSAQDHPEIVPSLIQEELDAGFIAHVPVVFQNSNNSTSEQLLENLVWSLHQVDPPGLWLTVQSAMLQPIRSCPIT